MLVAIFKIKIFLINKLSDVGRFFYSLAFTVLGLLCLLHDDFIIGRPPAWPDTWLLNPALAYVSGGMIIILSIAILAKKKGYEAALTIAGLTLLLSLSRHIPNVMNSWLNALKSVALFGGTLVIAASFNPKYYKVFLWTGCISLGAFFIACGYAHLKFYDFVTGFIPAYIPFHGFFTYFTAICLIAGGVGILTVLQPAANERP